MRWSFPHEALHYQRRDDDKAELLVSPEGNEAFEALILSLAGATH